MLFRKYRGFLKKGKYTLHSNIRTFILKDKTAIQYSKQLIPVSRRSTVVKKLISMVNFFPAINMKENGIDGFGASIMYIKNDNDTSGNIIFFDFDKMLLMQKCSCSKRYEDIIENNRYFSNYFNLAEIVYQDDEGFIYKEKIIDSKPKNTWTHELFKYIFSTIIEQYGNYFVHCNMKVNFFKEEMTIDTDNIVLNNFISKILNKIDPILLESQIPYFQEHGDLSFDNTLCENNKVYFIDFEHSDFYPFFYDLFFGMVNECTVSGNYLVFDSYLAGDFDAPLIITFKAAGFEYDPLFKRDYVLMYLAYLAKYRLKGFYEEKNFDKFRIFSDYCKREGI